jgi:hypothetical protein
LGGFANDHPSTRENGNQSSWFPLCSYWARGGDDCQQVYIGSKTNLYIANKLCEALTSVLGSNSMKEYEDGAVDLAQNPAKLQALTNKLKEVRMTCPLFDTARWVCSLKHYSGHLFFKKKSWRRSWIQTKL